MSELAFNVNGEPFEVPATATGWRVRRLKAKGAPEVVYGRDGTPLILPLDGGIDDLRAAVGTPGRYRLDPIEDSRTIPNAPAGYVFVHDDAAMTPTAPTALAPLPPPSDHIVIEALRMNAEAIRMNAEIARSVIERFPQMMEASALVLQAADGAGLPARQPRIADSDEANGTDDADDVDETRPPSTTPIFEMLNQVVAQIVPVLVMGLAPKLGALVDGNRKVIAAPKAEPNGPSTASSQTKPAAATKSLATGTALPAIEPAMLAKLAPIYAQLEPVEVTRAGQLVAQLTHAEVTALAEQLAAMSTTDALARVRSLIGTEQAS